MPIFGRQNSADRMLTQKNLSYSCVIFLPCVEIISPKAPGFLHVLSFQKINS